MDIVAIRLIEGQNEPIEAHRESKAAKTKNRPKGRF
jgi:hypothetical protein